MQQLCCTQIKRSSYVHNCSFENPPTKLFGLYLPKSWLSPAVWEEKSQSGDNAVVCPSLYAANLNSVRPQRSPWGWPLDRAIINVKSSLFLAGGERWFCFHPALLQQLLVVQTWAGLTAQGRSHPHPFQLLSEHGHLSSVPCGPMVVTSVVHHQEPSQKHMSSPVLFCCL